MFVVSSVYTSLYRHKNTTTRVMAEFDVEKSFASSRSSKGNKVRQVHVSRKQKANEETKRLRRQKEKERTLKRNRSHVIIIEIEDGDDVDLWEDLPSQVGSTTKQPVGKTVHFVIPPVRQEPEFVPSQGIKALVRLNEPATLREILMAIGQNSLTTDQAKALGVFIKTFLSFRQRNKKNVVRDGRVMSVLMYTPDEFISIEKGIRTWLEKKDLDDETDE